jgi:deoxyribodipyrimidine photo-lyase
MEARVRILNEARPREGARYVLYWLQANRRVESNHALLQATHLANHLRLPVLCYEMLTCRYPYASDRLHTFILEGVAETARRMRRAGVGYYFYLRRHDTDPDDIPRELARHAAAIVTDDFPAFLAAGHNASLPASFDIPYHAVDASCVVPMNLFEKREYAAYTIRPKIKRLLARRLVAAGQVRVDRRFDEPQPAWHTEVTSDNIAPLVASCDIDHTVEPSIDIRGGRIAAEDRLRDFLDNTLRRYALHRNEPSAKATSGLSPYLHFGYISSLETALAAQDHAARHKLIAEEFLDELIVRRELAFNFARHMQWPATLEDLPDWVRKTLAKHARDTRPFVYTCDQFERASTHDALWNACQRELLLRGTIHGYYRMYWGKKIIEWSATHEEALATMVYLHDRYALDGRDPNTYTNILWCFGLHDRPWQERNVFGTIRYMSLEGMKRKTNVSAYVEGMNQISARHGSYTIN